MNNNFKKRLEEFLDSECEEYGLIYTWKWIDECDFCEVELENNTDFNFTLFFKYNEENDDLLINTYEDVYEIVREFDWRVKYFWILVSPKLFN